MAVIFLRHRILVDYANQFFYKSPMLIALFLSITLGLASVLQGGLNRQIATTWGFTAAAFFNTLVLLVSITALFIISRRYPAMLPEVLRERNSFSSFSWWYLLPGLCGLYIILGMPLVISKIGAVKLFMGFIAAQLVGSLIWDACMEGMPVNAIRIIGVALSFLAVWLVSWKG